ncbi:MAG: BBP7 family outer membrane beta-barrel protein [Pirellula sp.]
MRIDRKKLTLIIASLCGTGSSAVALGQDYYDVVPASSAGRIGDGGVANDDESVSDVPNNSRPTAFRSNVVGDATPAPSYLDSSMQFTPHEYSVGGEGCSGACGASSCGSVCAPSRGPRNGSLGWLESETLLWWGKGVAGVPLVVGGATPNETPTTVLAGGQDNRLGTNLLVGGRVNVGKWLDCNQTLGVGARGWGIFTDGTNQTFTNGGNSTGVPYFSTFFGSPAIYNVNEAQTGQGANTGTIQLATDLDLIAGELYLRTLLAQQGCSRVDFLTGYTFVRLDSSLGLTTEVVDGLTGNIIQDGTITTTQDTFGTKNQFHGGHLGLLHELNKGRFTFSALGKISLGNMQSSTRVDGQFSITNTQSPAAGPRGLFAQSSNIGVNTRNQFTFLPEAGAKIKYQLGQAQFGIGYTMLLFPSVAMAADQIDPNIDFVGAVNNQPILSPSPRFATDTFFLHGLDLGLTFKF